MKVTEKKKREAARAECRKMIRRVAVSAERAFNEPTFVTSLVEQATGLEGGVCNGWTDAQCEALLFAFADITPIAQLSIFAMNVRRQHDWVVSYEKYAPNDRLKGFEHDAGRAAQRAA